MKKSQRLTESAIMLALAFVLSFVSIIDMPFGGKVTAFSMLPIAIIAYRYKTVWGLFTGLAYAILQMLVGLQNLTYATSWVAGLAIIMLDYLVAFTVLGLAGLFRGVIKDGGCALATGTLLACFLRYVCHVISGCTVWAGVSIPTSDGLIYSLAYNAAYMIPETILTVAGAYFAGKILTLEQEKITRVPMERKVSVNVFTAIPVTLCVVFSFIFIFGMMQTEEGFDITALGSADIFAWLPVIITVAVGAAVSVIVHITMLNSDKAKAAK